MSTAPTPPGATGVVSTCFWHEKDGTAPIRLLLIEDNPSDSLFLRSTLESQYPGHYAASVAASLGEAKSLLRQQVFEAALLDLSLPDSQGLDTIGRLAAAAPDLPIVVLSGMADVEIVPEAVRHGAQDYLFKGQCDGATIARSVHYAMDRKRIEDDLRQHQRELEKRNQELKEAQRRLEAYRDRYINLYEFAPLGYVTLDEDGYVQEINLAGAQLLNADRDAIIGFPFADHVAKEDVARLSDHVRKCVEERGEVTSELRLIARGGRVIAAHLCSIPVEGPPDEGIFCKTAVTDITQLKEMEDAIRQSCTFLQTVVDAIPDPIVVIARDYRVVLANRSARDVSGEHDIVTRCLPCYQVSHDRDAPCEDDCHPCPLRRVVETKAPVTMMHTHYDAQHREVFVEVTAAPVLDATGEVTHIIESCRDITTRKRAEEALAQDRNMLRALIDNLPDCIYVKDAQGRFVTANLATARIMGVAGPSDLLGKSDADFYPPDRAAEYRADEEELLRSGEPLVNKDEPHVDQNGELRNVVTTKVPLTDRGKVVGLVGISHDITERTRSRKSLADAKAAAWAAEEAQGRFLANISHELLTPMNAILGMIDMALPKVIDPRVQDCLETARGSADQLLGLLNDLLDLARIEAKSLKLRPASFSLRETLHQIALVLAVRANEKRISFSYQIAPEVPDSLVGDERRLRQVLLGLAENGIKFTERGEVTVGVHVESRAAREVGLEFSVRDTGVGIPPSRLSSIFDPFAQTDSPPARRLEGTGLGLPIAQTLVSMMGGCMWGESEVGRGSTFHFTVRLSLAAEAPESSGIPLTLTAQLLRPLRILVVEDNAASQKLAAYLFQERGHLVAFAGDGQEAVYMAEQERYDAIVMDMQMPEMDGLEATRAIRTQEAPGTRVPIIAMTAHTTTDARERCLAAGMDGYLAKPVDGGQLIALVESLAIEAAPGNADSTAPA